MAHEWMTDDILDDRDLLSSDRKSAGGNFFDYDEDEFKAMDFNDLEQVDGFMRIWKKEATKKMKKKQEVAKPIKPEEEETIGEKYADLSSLKPKGKGLESRSVSSTQFGSHQMPSLRHTAADSAAQSRPRTATSPPSLADSHQQVEKLNVPPVRETINKLLVGKPVVLEWYRSMEDKKKLLHEAILTHDGNTIITVILFIQKTLNRALFEVLLAKNPLAASHYCSFLRQNSAWNDLKSIYYVLGDQSFGMLQFQLCLSTDDYSARISGLDRCALQFRARPSLKKEAVFVEEYRDLLTNQLAIQKQKFAASAMARATILDDTLMVTLTYLCRFHSADPETKDTSPVKMQKKFNVSEKQFFVIKLVSLCVKEEWDEIEKLLTPKGLQSKFGLGSKVKTPIPLERLIRILGKYNIPEELLTKYVKQIDDPEMRLDFAKKYRCHEIVMEMLKTDAQKAQEYYSALSVEEQRKYRPKIAKILKL